MGAFRRCLVKVKGDEHKIHQFFNKHLDHLDESLLAALPHLLSKLAPDPLLQDRENVAYLLMSFGAFITEFPSGDRALNLELSLAATHTALKALPRESHPQEWAGIHNNLGVAYSNRIRGDRAENLEQAIAAYELALQVFTHKAFPEDWAEIQNNLGGTYFDRIRGDRAENLEQAIAAYELALQVRTREAFPEKWAAIQNNLGNAYGDRIRGNRAENLEQVIRAYELALQVHTREAFPEDWARIQNNLGLAYRDRIEGDPAKNLAVAVNLYQQAAEIFTQDALPLKWAENQGNLAETLMKRAALTENSQDLDEAIRLLHAALEVAVPGSPDGIDSHYRLGNALSRRFEHRQDPTDLEQALQAYTAALEAISPEHYDRAKIWQALPATQSIVGSRLVRQGEWQEGLQILLNSVRLLRQGDDPLAHANALYQTAVAHEALADWDNARLYYRDALRLYQHVNDSPGIAKSYHGLGSVLASQGYFKKGMAALAQARDLYEQLGKVNRVAEVESLYQSAQRAEQQVQEMAV